MRSESYLSVKLLSNVGRVLAVSCSSSVETNGQLFIIYYYYYYFFFIIGIFILLSRESDEALYELA